MGSHLVVLVSQALSSHLCYEVTLAKLARRGKCIVITLSSILGSFSYYKIAQRAHSTHAVNGN